jgi:DnaK suppressor protein
MKRSDRDHFEGRLLQERERAIKAVRQLDESARLALIEDGDLTTLPLHLADEGTDAMEQEKALLLLGQEGRQLVEIDSALRRLYGKQDEFGKCEMCGGEIAFERLDIVPWAMRCLSCQERLEENIPGETGVQAGESGGAP